GLSSSSASESSDLFSATATTVRPDLPQPQTLKAMKQKLHIVNRLRIRTSRSRWKLPAQNSSPTGTIGHVREGCGEQESGVRGKESGVGGQESGVRGQESR